VIVGVLRVGIPISATVRAEVVGMMADAVPMGDGGRWIMRGTIKRKLFVGWSGEYGTEFSDAGQDMR
jgi:hypothetical protein